MNVGYRKNHPLFLHRYEAKTIFPALLWRIGCAARTIRIGKTDLTQGRAISAGRTFNGATGIAFDFRR
jgi:hypothetical protein